MADVRSIQGVPGVGSFGAFDGTPLVVDRDSANGYVLKTDGTVALLKGGSPTFGPQSANVVLAGPATGAAAEPAFRALVTADLANDLVTYAKIQNVTDARLLGRSAGSAGDVMEITVGSGLSLSAGALTATSAGIAIGSAVSGATPFGVLSTDGSGNLIDSPYFLVDHSTFIFTLDGYTFSNPTGHGRWVAAGSIGLAFDNVGGTQGFSGRTGTTNPFSGGTIIWYFGDTGRAEFPVDGPNAGVQIGGTTLIYCSAADTLRTPDNLIVELNLSVGVTATARLHLPAGTATAGTAPVKINDGTLLTAIEDGALEFASDKLYFSTTSSIRRRVSLDYYMLFDHFADANNGTTVETDLYSDTIAAGQLAVNAQKVLAQYAGTFTGDATSTQRLRGYFGGTLIFDTGALGFGVGTVSWDLTVITIRVSSSVVRCSATLNTSFASLNAYAAYTEVTGLTLANTQALKITGTAAGATGGSNQITAKEGFVEFRSEA